MNMLKRFLSSRVQKGLQDFPAVAILGPRQCGKSTLAKSILEDQKQRSTLYLDLERPSNLNLFREPELFFSENKDKLICLDEIQRLPEFFPLLRSVIDDDNRNGQLLLLGSASRDLIRQSSESLAGRIHYLELSPFLIHELGEDKLRDLWLKGGFPRAILNTDENTAFEWHESFVNTFLERDLSNLGFNFPPLRMHRFWMMCAHIHGQLINRSKLGESLGVSYHTIQSYLEALEGSFMVRILRPFVDNLKKRLIKSPKVYIRDSGILHSLLNIKSFNELLGHPAYGSSWEGFAMENILSSIRGWEPSFYRDSYGNEIDLLLQKGNDRIAIEFKASTNPKPSAFIYKSIEVLSCSSAWIVSPVEIAYPLGKDIRVTSLSSMIQELQSKG